MRSGIGAGTRLVFLAGDPIGHTRGYAEYAAALEAAGLDAVYLPAHVPAGGLGAFLTGLAAVGNVAGVVATVPHKQDALRLGVPDERARRSGAANVLRRTASGWTCTEVDGAGFLAAADSAGIEFAGRVVQIVGAGGAGRSVATAIASRGPAAIWVHDLDEARAASLVAALGDGAQGGLVRAEALVNCSTVGMHEGDGLPVPLAMLPERGAVYDVVNQETKLVAAAAARGCRVDHGRSMMLAQVPLVIDYLLR